MNTHLSKEETLYSKIRTDSGVREVMYNGDGRLINHDVLDAMSEYAEQKTMAFANWLSENYYMDSEGYYHHDYQNKIHFTAEELYDKYTQSSNQ